MYVYIYIFHIFIVENLDAYGNFIRKPKEKYDLQSSRA